MQKKNILHLGLLSPVAATVGNLLLLYVVYFVARVTYLLVNYSYFSQNLSFGHLAEMFRGGLVFDTSAILVTNIPYVVLMLLPWHGKETKAWHALCRWVYLIVNGLALVVNLCDAVYFRYTMRRTTTTVFSEFSNESNLSSVFFTETLRHFYLVVLFVIVVWLLYRIYVDYRTTVRKWWRYDLAMLLSLAALAPFVVAGIRGGFTTAVRPVTISNANQYVDRPVEAALVLNTPFSLYRTIGKAVFTVPQYFDSEEEMARVFSPVHVPADTVPMTKKNVVVLIVESFGREYIGALNKTLENGNYRGYTPCVDSLIAKSITFTRSYCNGRKSIDGMPSILSSIPMFVEPFFLSPYSVNHVGGLAECLGKKGYQTAFFHGAERGSMGFMAFARATKFQQYFGREDFCADPRTNGDEEFDGWWGISDEPFLQYFKAKMDDMRQPFMTALFTLSSHHPFRVPMKWAETFPEEHPDMPIYKVIRYSDMALRHFFSAAKKEPWYANTLFVITNDHNNMAAHDEYRTDLGGFASPLIFFDPSGEVTRGMDNRIAQQIDVMPTVLDFLGYDQPYLAFGKSLLSTPEDSCWAVCYTNGIYQYMKHGHVMQFDGERTTAVYALDDLLMRDNKLGQLPWQAQMEQELKAIIQQYMERMTQNRLTP